MKKIYISGNYIVVDNNGRISEYAKSRSFYTLDSGTFILSEDGGGRISIPSSEANTWFDKAGEVAFDATTLAQFLKLNTAENGRDQRFSLVIDVSIGQQAFKINDIPVNGEKLSLTAVATGLNGTGSDLDFSGENSGNILVIKKKVFGTTVGLTPAANDNTLNGEFLEDYLYLDFEPNDATTGTIRIDFVFK